MISDYLSKLGSFDVELRDDTPWDVREKLQQKGTLVVTPGDLVNPYLDPADVVDNARYSGMVQALSFDRLRIEGVSGAGFIGDDGNPMVGPRPYTTGSDQWTGTMAATLENQVWGPSGHRNGITLNAQVFGVSETVNVEYETQRTLGGTTSNVGIKPVRAQLDAVCEAFKGEWRYNPWGEIEAGLNVGRNALQARVIVAPQLQFCDGYESGGVDPFNDALAAGDGMVGMRLLDLDGEDHSKNYADTVRLFMMPPDGVTSDLTGVYNATDLFTGFAGQTSPVYEARVTRQGAASSSVADDQAEIIQRNDFNLGSEMRRCDVECYDIGRYLRPGDWFGLFAPESGFADTNVWQIQGLMIPARYVRCHGTTWPVREGMGVFHIASDGSDTVTRLSPHVAWEDGPAQIHVDGLPSSLSRRIHNR